ncbi:MULTISPECIES: translation initiation factor IF-2 N-terminal domain-containing protein [unclassified Prochlorococcus]|uniref:translation initiation factor IF-2 N-terminal domain-containing protein n=1 Tax=unclassified Prochlorococcus TaxID=2627481 RepID=UPI0009079AEC|nr:MULTISPECIES: translation initiation factor IF-2 N-terminal domain-containing protein [unclassified Prochlorococcus]
MSKTLRVLELSEQLQKDADDIIAICVLLDIPASSRISCLTNENAQKIIDYYKEKLKQA